MNKIFFEYHHFLFGKSGAPLNRIARTLLTFIIITCAVTVVYAAQKKPPRKDAALVLESANSNENTYTNGEFVSVLTGNVVFTYENTRIQADEATWWRNQGIIQFRKNIRVTTETQTLTCDRMSFTRNNTLLTAIGNFKFIDTLEQAQLTGDQADYYLEEKRFFLRGNPRLIRYYSASAETLTISGTTMSYIDTLKKAIVSDNVKITKGKLISKCNYAHYFTEQNIAWLRTKPRVIYDHSLVDGDSINLIFGKEALEKAIVYGNAHGIYTDTMTNQSDTTFTHIRGDSLVITVSDSGNLDSLYTFGKARSEYYSTSDPSVVNEASGRVMVMAFSSKGVVTHVTVAGNARSKYFVEEQNSKGINEASGDSIMVTFRKGKASLLTLSGSARGMYIPKNL